MMEPMVIEFKIEEYLWDFVMLHMFLLLESSTTSDPQFPVLQLTNLNTNILNALQVRI